MLDLVVINDNFHDDTNQSPWTEYGKDQKTKNANLNHKEKTISGELVVSYE